MLWGGESQGENTEGRKAWEGSQCGGQWGALLGGALVGESGPRADSEIISKSNWENAYYRQKREHWRGKVSGAVLGRGCAGGGEVMSGGGGKPGSYRKGKNDPRIRR